MDDLIFDRTEEDVAYALENPSSNEFLKGAYNYTDLNRIETWCNYLATQFNYYSYPVNITTKTNWTDADFPTQANMDRIRNNINLLKAAFYSITNTPSTLNQMTYKKANEIEKILYELNENLENMVASFVYSGEVYAGEV